MEKPAALLAAYQLPDANALEVARLIRSELDRMAQRFPEDVAYQVTYDTTLYVETSIQEVVITLFQALALVVLVVFIFLQDWRSTLIPGIAIPVSLIGTLAVLLAMGFTINTISLFGLILAIGVVVDDAIVVVENVQRHMADGLNPRDATRKAMEGGNRTRHRNDARAACGFRAGRFHAGYHRAPLCSVRRNNFGRGHSFINQRR